MTVNVATIPGPCPLACPLRVVPVWISQFERHVGAPVVIAALDEDAGGVAKKQELAEEKMRLVTTLLTGVVFLLFSRRPT